MQQRRMLAGVIVAAMSIAACARDSASPTIGEKLSSGAAAVNPGDTAGAQPSTPDPVEPTSDKPVVSVTLSPASLSIGVGHYGHIQAVGRDVDGIRVANARPTWTSTDPNIVIASDTGIMYGKTIGTTTVTATVSGHTATGTVTVVASTIPQPPPPPPAVSSFDLTATVAGALLGADTSRTEIVAGARVHLMRTGGVSGDTLATPVDAGTATTDANGVVSFKSLAGGWYTVDITPPSGSPYAPSHTGFGPARVSDVSVRFVLRRN